MSVIDYPVKDDRGDERWRPLLVSCRVVQPVIYYGDGLNLDGLLAFGAFQELSDMEKSSLGPLNAPWVEDFEMPVAKWACPRPDDRPVDERLLTADGELWGWCSSDVQSAWEGRQPYDVRKMPPADEIKRLTRDRGVNVINGRFKGSNVKYEGWWPVEGLLTWYVLGDKEGVERLLRHVPNVGKLHNHGYGKVDCTLNGEPIWRVEEIENDYSIEDASGSLTRAMPAGYQGRDGHRVDAPIRAPRHHRSRYVACVR